MAFTVVDGWTVPGFTHERELGDGAAGRVVLAVDDLTSTRVAIKYLDRALGADESFLARFRAAARSLSQLEDPNVVDFYDFVETADGTAIVMQCVEGVSLRRVLAAQGPTGPLAALSLLGGTLLGLAAAHEHDVVHGSMRPANVLVDGEGNARLTDFATAPAGTEAQLGPPYAAPELWDGAPATVATDLYAATAIFYECLTGHPPYTGRNMARQHREAPVPADEVPGPLRELIHQGLAKDPERRPKSAADYLAALEEAAVSAYGPSWEAQGRGRLTELCAQAAQRPEPPKPKQSRSSGRNAIVAGGQPGGGSRTRWVLAAVAVLVIAGAGAGAAAVLKKDDKQPPEPTPAQNSSPQPTLPAGGVDPAPLVARIDQATAQAPGAAFSYRQTGCCGFPVNGRGTFGLAQGGQASYTLTLAGTGSARKPVRAVIVQDRLYVRAGKKWRSSPLGGRGYAGAADQVRQGSSVGNLTALLRAATKLTRSGSIYEGEAPAAKLAQAPGVGPMYARMSQATGAQQIAFAIKFDSGYRPVRFWVRAGPEKGRNQMQHGSYTKWGRKPAVKAPR
ncbi:serine/threonine protein kinase [Actinomadura madurae]|uniref:non-specific serine/threonine protein kinase n=1 Tax=Actinomadura madurae TaxID=1993 RepID=A0A1I5EIE0_9ACTN|nr:serine/threonine-protein kinase [Actinomadura madurae]SFO11267.1 Protein kinase domain-containing protein [Actinomadura madurae]SPT59954.1 Serine/threonine-protein kinase PrkC [Actinomadura madurae]